MNGSARRVMDRSTAPAADHRFSGTTGETADLMAEVARRMDATRHERIGGAECEALRRKRFHAALAVARHDPAAAAGTLRRLLSELA